MSVTSVNILFRITASRSWQHVWEVLAAPGSEHGKERLDLGLGSPLISIGAMLISEKVTVHLLLPK